MASYKQFYLFLSTTLNLTKGQEVRKNNICLKYNLIYLHVLLLLLLLLLFKSLFLTRVAEFIYIEGDNKSVCIYIYM